MKRGKFFVSDDKVRLIKDCQDIVHPEIFKTGETGRLRRLYRTQDGVEFWSMILDRRSPICGRVDLCVCDTDIERIDQ